MPADKALSSIIKPAMLFTGRERTIAPVLVFGPAWLRMERMMAAFFSVLETIRMISFSLAIET